MSSVPFPRTTSASNADDDRSLLAPGRDRRASWVSTMRASACEVHDVVYGNASASDDALERLYEPNAIYENPLVTATSLSVIADIHFLTRRVQELAVPMPWTVSRVATLLGKEMSGDPLFYVSRVWSEIGEICESESFDANRTSIVEHTLHILLLPGLHRGGPELSHPSPSSTLDLVTASVPPPGPHATLAVGGLPSPLHFQLRVTTRLSFNEQGRITHHRDSWDVRDVLALVPGLGAAQAVTTRLTAFAASLGAWALGGHAHPGDAARALTAPGELSRGNALGLAGVRDDDKQP